MQGNSNCDSAIEKLLLSQEKMMTSINELTKTLQKRGINNG